MGLAARGGLLVGEVVAVGVRRRCSAEIAGTIPAR